MTLEEIEKSFKEIEEHLKKIKEEMQMLITENRIKINFIIMNNGVNKETIPKIISLYEQIEETILKYRLDYSPLEEYIDFLVAINSPVATEKQERLQYLKKVWAKTGGRHEN